MGYPSALSAKTWGFYDVAFKGRPFEFERPLGSYVMENVLFKISFPAEFPRPDRGGMCTETAPPGRRQARSAIERIEIQTQEAGMRIIDKTGPLANYADRDHCIQYMVAVPLIFGRLTADDYGDAVAADPRIDALREKMSVRENPQFTKDYFDPDKRYIGNSPAGIFQGWQQDRAGLHRLSGLVIASAAAEGIPVLDGKSSSTHWLAICPPAKWKRYSLEKAANPAEFRGLARQYPSGCDL